MDVTDEDMQMVRDFLSQSKAPFHIKSHFENLVDQHAIEAARVEELKEQVDELEAEESDELDKLRNERHALQSELDDICGEGMRGALETIRYWLLDVLAHGRPMQKPPRQILRIVEDVL